MRVLHGGLRWTACDAPPEATPAQIAAVRAGFQTAVRTLATDRVGPTSPADLPHAMPDDAVYEAFVLDRAAFLDAAIPPLPALYEAAGLEVQRSIVAERGFDWDKYRTWQDRNRLAAVYGLADGEVELLVVGVGATLTWLDEGDDGLGATDDERRGAARLLSAILDDGAIAEAYGHECLRRGASWDDLVRFADDLDARLDGPTPVGLAWVRARGLDLAGDAAGAIDVLERAVTVNVEHEPALVDLAGFRADRGDAPGAYALLRRSGVTEPVEDDPYSEADEAELLLEEVAGFALHRPRPVAGRNDRCPCGSGRKYKACHLGRERHPLDDRAGWLFEKARRFLRRRARDVVDDLADEMVDPIDHPLQWRELRESPWVADLALHEGGVFAEFLAARDALLPDDEALLAAQWALTHRGVFEIQRVEHDVLELHDIGRGETITVTNVIPSERTHKGIVLVGRPLPVGDTYRAFGGFIELPRALVAQLLHAIDDVDPIAIAATVGETMRPPRMQNTDGHDLVLHTMRWRCPDSVDVGAALLGTAMKADSDGASWTLVRDTTGQTDAVIAHLRLAGDELTGDVNSDQRAAELLALVTEALPDAHLLDDERRSIEEAMAEIDPDEAPTPPQLDPAMRQVLADFVAEHERRWLDESIPTLGGRTPREAAADPIGREELEHLLDSFPSARTGRYWGDESAAIARQARAVSHRRTPRAAINVGSRPGPGPRRSSARSRRGRTE